MIPDIGSEWKARDGRIMKVLDVHIPDDPAKMPKVRLEVVNAKDNDRKITTISSANFGSELSVGFLRPIGVEV